MSIRQHLKAAADATGRQSPEGIFTPDQIAAMADSDPDDLARLLNASIDSRNLDKAAALARRNRQIVLMFITVGLMLGVAIGATATYLVMSPLGKLTKIVERLEQNETYRNNR